MAPKPFRSAGIGQQSSHQQAILLNGCSGKTGWWGLQHATSKALCQQPVSVPPSQRNTAVSSSTSAASSIGQLQHEGPTSREAAARQQVQPTLSTPKKAGGKRGLEHESKLAKLQRRAEVMKRFEEAVKATSEKQELKDLMAQHAKQVRKLDPGEIVLVCNQMAKLCDPQRMPWRAWKEMQGWATQMLALLDPSLEQLSTFELVVLLAALARMNYSPSAEWLTHYFDVTMPRIPNCGPGHLTLMLRALSRLEAGLWELKEAPNFKHWMQRMLDNAHCRLRSFKGRELVHLLQALADIKWMPSQAWLASYSAIFRRRLDMLDPPMISTAMLAFATLKYDPGIPLAHAMYTNMATNLPLFEAKDLATTAQAIATIRKRLQRREFLDGFMSEVLQKLPTFGAKHLANLLHALATLVSQGLIRPNTATYPVGAPQLQPQSPLLQQPPPSPRQQQQQQERQQQEQQQQQEQREVHLQQQIRLQQAEASQAAQQQQQPDLQQQQQQQQQSMELGQQSKLLDGTRVASDDVSQPSVGSGSSAEHVHFKQSSSGLSSTEDSREMRSGHTGMGICPQPSADVGAFSLSASSSSSNSKNSNSSEAQGSANGSSNRNTSAQGSETGSDSPSSSSSRADSGGVVKSGGSIDWSRSSIDWSRSSIDWSSGSVDWSASSIDESSSRSKTLHDGPSSRVGGGSMRVARPTRHAPPEDMSSSSSSSSSSNSSSTDGAASPAPVNPVQPSPASLSPTLPATTQSAPIGVPSNTASSSSSPSADRNLEGGDSSSSSSNSGGPSPVHVPAAAGPSPPLASLLPFQLPRAVVWTTVPPIPGSPSSGPVRLPAPTLTWLDAAAHRVHALMPDTNGGTLATAVWGLSMLGLPANQAFLDGFVATTRGKFTEMSVDELVFTVQALSNFRYRPSNMPAFEDWLHEFSRLAERRRVDARQVCDLVPALSGLPLPPPESLVCTLLTRSRKGRPNSIRHASPRRLANLALSFRAMGFKPDFSFLHLYAQAVRFHWSNFEPWEYAAVLSGMASFSPSSLIIDELWLGDLLTVIQGKAHRFDAASASYTLQAAAHLTRQKAQQPFAPPVPQLPSKQWSHTLLSRVHMVMPSLTPPQAVMVLCYLATRHQASGYATPPPPQPILPMNFANAKHSSGGIDTSSTNGPGTASGYVAQGPRQHSQHQTQRDGQQPQQQEQQQQQQQQLPYILAPPQLAVPLVPSQVLFPAQPFQTPLQQTMPFSPQAVYPPQPTFIPPGHSTAQQPPLPAQAPLPFYPHPSLQRASTALPQRPFPSSPFQPSLSQQPLHEQPLHHPYFSNSGSSSSSQQQQFPSAPPPSPPPIAAPSYPPPLISPAAATALSQTSGASTELLADLVAKATMHPGLLSPMQASDLLWALRILGISLPYPLAAAMQAQAQGPLRSGQQQQYQQQQQQQQQQQHDFLAVQPSRPPSPGHLGRSAASSSLGGWDQPQQAPSANVGQHMVFREDASKSWPQQHVEFASTSSSSSSSSSSSHDGSWTGAMSAGRGGRLHSITSDLDLSQERAQAQQRNSHHAEVMLMQAPDQAQRASASIGYMGRGRCQRRGSSTRRGDAGMQSASAGRVMRSTASGRRKCDASRAHAWMLRQRQRQQF